MPFVYRQIFNLRTLRVLKSKIFVIAAKYKVKKLPWEGEFLTSVFSGIPLCVPIKDGSFGSFCALRVWRFTISI
jgi:hypothetical protein